MKLKSFFALLLGAATLFVSCSETDDATEPDNTSNATSISLDIEEVTLAINGYTTLVATLEPTDATGTITWSSSDSSVAAVSDGTVVGVSEGSATIAATCGSLTATCAVTVVSASDHESLKGSNYYLVAMDYITYDSVADNVVADLRTDDINSFLYVWSGYTAGTTSGVNAYGQTESWTSLEVLATDGWSGLGVCVGENGDYTPLANLSDITDNPGDYFLHIAMKSSSPVSHLIKLEDVGAGSCVIGNNGAIDSREPDYDFTTDGEWQHFDIPMTHFTDQGFAFSPSYSASLNVFIVLSGGTDGVKLDYDAVFFYKK